MNTKKKEPVRMCCACRKRQQKSELIRIVKVPASKENHQLKLDLTQKANGRGAYLCRDENCIKKALKKKSLNRAFSCNVPEELYKILQEEVKNNG